MICNVCGKYVEKKDSVLCVQCANLCHGSCYDYDPKSKNIYEDKRMSWRCTDCKSNSSKEDDYKIKFNGNQTIKSIEDLLNQIQGPLVKSIEQLNSNFSNLKWSVDSTSYKCDKLVSEMTEIKDNLGFLDIDIKALQNEIDKIKSENSLLKFEIDNIYNITKQENIILNGLPETVDENIPETIKHISLLIGADLNPNNVTSAHRLPGDRRDGIRPIVIKFSQLWMRDYWLRCFKLFSKTHEDGPGFPLKLLYKSFPPPEGRVTAGDHLETLDLLAAAKEAASKKGYKNIWSQNGIVVVYNPSTGGTIRIASLADLKKL